MSLLTENVVILAKKETIYGTDATPAAADALRVTQPKLTPLEASYVSRDLAQPGSGAQQELITGIHCMVEFKCELVGSGTLGTAPAFGKLIEACRWKETIVATTSVAYRPDITEAASLTISFFMDGQLHKLLGARGTFTVEFNSQGIPYLAFKFTGLYVAPTATAAPGSLTGWADFLTPEVIDFDHTPVPDLQGYGGVFKAFSFDAGSDVQYFNNPGEEIVQVVRHACTGSITMHAPAIGTKDYFASVVANTLGTFKLQHGQTATTQWFLESMNDQCQVLRPRYGDDNGRATIEADLKFIPTDVNDEIELRFAAT